MRIFTNLNAIPEDAKGAIIAIGNFDGVHRGHQHLLQTAKDLARAKSLPFGVLTFEPHPRRLFRPDDPPSRITPRALKNQRLEAFGVDNLFSIPFDWDFASQSADHFIQNVLTDALGAAHVVIGADFRFGQLRKGAPEDIERAGINLTIVDKITCEDGEMLSSSRIRQHLRHGEIEEANKALGWSWEMSGEVVKGDQRGRELGFPTANFALKDTVHPAYGVYAVLARIEGEEQWRPAATNIGIRPMFEIPTAQVETYIFDFDREIYGQTLHVRPAARLRSEAKFASLDALVEQMKIDCDQAREVVKR